MHCETGADVREISELSLARLIRMTMESYSANSLLSQQKKDITGKSGLPFTSILDLLH